MKQSQALARCGNSGNSFMPHIRYHLQDSLHMHQNLSYCPWSLGKKTNVMYAVTMSIAQIKRLYYDQGLSCQEVADELGLTIWQVIARMKKHQLPRRTAAETGPQNGWQNPWPSPGRGWTGPRWACQNLCRPIPPPHRSPQW